MTEVETTRIIRVIKAAYPKYYEKFTPQDFDELIALWSVMLEEYPYEAVNGALKSYLANDVKGFPPVVGQIIDHLQKINPVQALGELEAWALVYKAICNSAYNADSEFRKLPPAVQKAIGSADNLREMSKMEIETVQSVEQSHFIKAYRSVVDREKEVQKLPAAMREQFRISTLANDNLIESKC